MTKEQQSFDEIRMQNVFVMGELGESYKIKTFKETDFNETLAPERAIFQRFKNDNTTYVRMTY